MKKFGLIAAILPLFLTLLASPVDAIAKVSPLLVSRKDIKRGETVSHLLTLENQDNSPKVLRIRAVDFNPSPKGNGEPEITTEANQKYGISNWFIGANAQNTITVPARQQITYEAKFQVPYSAEDRTYFGAVLFSDDSTSPTTTTSSLVFMTVGQPEPQLNVLDVTFDEKANFGNPKGQIEVTVENTGQGIYENDLPVELKVTDSKGNVLEAEAEDEQTRILPESVRKLVFTTETLPAGDLNITASIKNNPDSAKTIDVDRPDPLAEDADAAAVSEDSDDDSDPAYGLWIIGAFALALLLSIAGWFAVKRIHAKHEAVPVQQPLSQYQSTEPQEYHEPKDIGSGGNEDSR